jgi:site-specific recombinase XerD
VRNAIRRRHYSDRTEETYVHWIKRFIYFSGRRHPAEMRAEEVTAFLNHLASEREVAAATQNQALSALLFLYKEVLAQPLPWLDGLERAKRPARMPEAAREGRRFWLPARSWCATARARKIASLCSLNP